MDNIRIIRTGINVSKIKAQLEKYSDDWGGQKNMPGTQQLDKDQYIIKAGVLQLVMGAVNNPNELAVNTELCVETPAYKNHTEIINFLKRHFHKFCRYKSKWNNKSKFCPSNRCGSGKLCQVLH